MAVAGKPVAANRDDGLPDAWELRPLLNAVRLARGQVDPRIEPYRSMVLVAPDHIERETGKLLAKQTAGEQGAISGKYVFEPGDIIYSKIRPYLRKAILADFAGLCSADMYPLTPASDVAGGFMLATLLAHRFSTYAESVSVRSGMPKINRIELAGFAVKLPPLLEQKAIAAALSDVDALLSALDRLIAKKRDLKQAAMQQLLTGQTRLPGFSGKWADGQLADVIASLQAGVSVNSIEDDGGLTHGELSILKTSAVAGGRFTANECKRIAPRELSRARLNPQGDTLLISRMNTPDLVGECGYVDRTYPNLFVPDRLWMTRFRHGSDTSALWLAYVLSTPPLKRHIGAAATGTSGSMKNLSKRAFLEIPMVFPGGGEQRAIASVLSDMDSELTALEQRRDKTRLLKQGMMQELLTGKTRLV